MKRTSLLLTLLFLMTLALGAAYAQDAVVELRLTWYNDGNEGEILQDLLDRFQAENPDIRVIVDTIPYADLHTTLQTQIEGGTPPDMARITDVARFAGSYLQLNDLVADSQYWVDNFPAAVLTSLRGAGDNEGIYGFPLQFTVTVPFINRTLFEQAGVPVPSDTSDEVSWETWVDAAVQVAEVTETPYAVAIDRSGHRFWGYSLVLGASYINEDGSFTIDSEGFRSAAENLINWNQQGLTPPEVWAGSGGSYVAATDYFINAQVVLYYAGTWQIGNFTNTIGDSFDWELVPNPTGPGGSTGIPGGSVLVGFASTEHPEEVARVMDYLASEPVVKEFSERTLFIPGHLGLIESGVDYSASAEALTTALAEIPKISDQAYALQYSPYTFILNTELRDRLSQVVVGEITLDDAVRLVQERLDQAAAEAA